MSCFFVPLKVWADHPDRGRVAGLLEHVSEHCRFDGSSLGPRVPSVSFLLAFLKDACAFMIISAADRLRRPSRTCAFTTVSERDRCLPMLRVCVETDRSA